ncbi:MAG: nucleoside-diphosphate sugar epimerase/dehydratase [Enterocloster clostridioformis]
MLTKDKQGRVIDGVSIMGEPKGYSKTCKEKGIDEIYVSHSCCSSEDIRDILKICQGTGCQVKILPGVYQLMNGEVTISRLRKVEIEDLLGREPVNVNLDEIMGYVKGKVVLVTGGGGSSGGELCRQLALHIR